jgi:hypothetical protein
LSPAKIEKLLPKEGRAAMAELTRKQSSGTTLAKESDSRPAVKAGPAADFTVID